MWIKVVPVSAKKNNYQVKWGIRQNGQGLRKELSERQYFDKLEDVEAYARAHDIDYIEWPDGTVKP